MRCYLEHFCRDTVSGEQQGDATWHAFAGIPCQVGSGKRHLARFCRDSVRWLSFRSFRFGGFHSAVSVSVAFIPQFPFRWLSFRSFRFGGFHSAVSVSVAFIRWFPFRSFHFAASVWWLSSGGFRSVASISWLSSAGSISQFPFGGFRSVAFIFQIHDNLPS